MKKLSEIQIGLDFEHPPVSPLDRGELTKEETLVWEIVREHRGKDAAILGPMISAQAGIEYDRLRAVISHLVNEHHCLIASYSRGYYIPVTSDEIDQATKSLRHRGIMILMRASRLQKISLENIFQQARIEYEGR